MPTVTNNASVQASKVVTDATAQAGRVMAVASVQTIDKSEKEIDKRLNTAGNNTSSGSFNINDLIGHDLGLGLPPPPPPTPQPVKPKEAQKSTKKTLAQPSGQFARPWKLPDESPMKPTIERRPPAKRKISSSSHSIEKLAESKKSTFKSIPLPEPKLALVGQRSKNTKMSKRPAAQKPQIWSHVSPTKNYDQYSNSPQVSQVNIKIMS